MNNFEIVFLKDLYLYILYFFAAIFFTTIFQVGSYVKKFICLIVLVGISIYIGFRDFSVGVDTMNYIDIFYSMESDFNRISFRDPLWDSITFFFCTLDIDVSYYFLLWSSVYMIGSYQLGKYYFKSDSIYYLLLFLIVPNFFLFGVNTIRAGVASSILLYSFIFDYKKKKQYLFFLIALLVHQSVVVPIVFYLVSKRLITIKYPLILWCIFLPFAFLGISLINILPFGISRLNDYLVISDTSFGDKIVNFLLYSISPIALGVYVIYVKKLQDVVYVRFINTYILSNCIYILSFSLNFSERFAYMSEFLMPFLLLYPIIKLNIWKKYPIKLVILLFIVFLIKSYKIFII